MTPLKTLREYRSLYDQLDRFERLGWSKCDILNMNLVSDEIVLQSPEEHRRICSLEPFDEYDEQFWIGAYYFIAIATTGPKAQASSTPSQSPDVIQALGLRSKIQAWSSPNNPPEGSFASLSKATSESSAIPSQPIEWTAHNPIAGLEINRKGHTLSIIGDEAFIFGGFGLDPNNAVEEQKVFQQRSQQTRLGSMIQYNLVTGVNRIHPREEDGPAPRMHHSAATTLDGSAIYIYGGRDGPTKVHNDVWRYTVEDGWDQLWRGRISQEGDTSCPKGLFKHTANMMTVAGREMMVLFGGRLASGEANSQVWAFDLQDGQWGHFQWRSAQDQQTFGGVFSHSTVVTQDANHQECLLVVGGIRMSDEQVLNTVCQITLNVSENSQCWVDARAVEIRASTGEPLKPRFGHSAVAVDSDRIWILGGVSSPSLLQWHETMVEIQPRRATFLTLKPSCFRELVMVGHATALDAQRQRIIGTGGGGTCFGFGAWWDASAWGIHV